MATAYAFHPPRAESIHTSHGKEGNDRICPVHGSKGWDHPNERQHLGIGGEMRIGPARWGIVYEEASEQSALEGTDVTVLDDEESYAETRSGRSKDACKTNAALAIRT
jgi:hypothetical protein